MATIEPHDMFGSIIIKKLILGDHVNGYCSLLKMPWKEIADRLTACPPVSNERQQAFEVAVKELKGSENIVRSVALADPKQDLDRIIASLLWEVDFFPVDKLFDHLEREEAGDADLFAFMFQDRVLYDHSEKSWYLWAGHYWQVDRTCKVVNLVSDKVAAQYLYAATKVRESGGDPKLVEKFCVRAKALCYRRRIDNVLRLAASKAGIAISGDEWEQKPYLLPVENGVVDLSKGVLCHGNPKDYLRKHIPIVWEGLHTKTPLWDKFLFDIRDGNVEEIDFLRRLFGVCLLGQSQKKAFPVFYGPGGDNGKTTLAEIIGDVLGGDFAYTVPPEVIMKSDKSSASGQANSFLYNFRGKRFIWAAESKREQVLDVGLVKRLTGGDRITTRDVYSKAVSFVPSHMLFLLTNEKPKILGHDDAIWSRVCLIPFNVRFVADPIEPNQRKKVDDFKSLLRDEYSGIFSWMVRGAMEYRENGLMVPAQIQVAKHEYRNEYDSIHAFVEHGCILGPDLKTKSSVLYRAYQSWCGENGFFPVTQTQFGIEISKKFPKKLSGGVQILGIGLSRSQSQEDQQL